MSPLATVSEVHFLLNKLNFVYLSCCLVVADLQRQENQYIGMLYMEVVIP